MEIASLNQQREPKVALPLQRNVFLLLVRPEGSSTVPSAIAAPVWSRHRLTRSRQDSCTIEHTPTGQNLVSGPLLAHHLILSSES